MAGHRRARHLLAHPQPNHGTFPPRTRSEDAHRTSALWQRSARPTKQSRQRAGLAIQDPNAFFCRKRSSQQTPPTTTTGVSEHHPTSESRGRLLYTRLGRQRPAAIGSAALVLRRKLGLAPSLCTRTPCSRLMRAKPPTESIPDTQQALWPSCCLSSKLRIKTAHDATSSWLCEVRSDIGLDDGDAAGPLVA